MRTHNPVSELLLYQESGTAAEDGTGQAVIRLPVLQAGQVVRLTGWAVSLSPFAAAASGRAKVYFNHIDPLNLIAGQLDARIAGSLIEFLLIPPKRIVVQCLGLNTGEIATAVIYGQWIHR